MDLPLDTRRIAAMLLFLLIGSACLADPPSISTLSTSTSLAEADKAKIKEYAEFWGNRLADATGRPEDVRDIRDQLLAPVRDVSTEIFLSTYCRDLEPSLERAIKKGNAHVAVTALIVLSEIGTEYSLQLLLDHTGLPNEPRSYVRLAAARGCAMILGGGKLVVSRPAKITGAARTLLAAVKNEDDPYALRHQVEAILAAETPVTAAQQQQQIRGYLAEAMESTASRAMRGENPIGMLRAVYPVLNKLRVAFLNLPPGPQRQFGIELGPRLVSFLEVPSAYWTEARSGAGGQPPGDIIYLCERFLGTLDGLVGSQKPPKTTLSEAWEADDSAKYKADLHLWNAVVSKPPYRP